jgi:hypothetical protein
VRLSTLVLSTIIFRERRKRVAGEVQREYERQQLQEELQTRNRALADAAWQSLE